MTTLAILPPEVEEGFHRGYRPQGELADVLDITTNSLFGGDSDTPSDTFTAPKDRGFFLEKIGDEAALLAAIFGSTYSDLPDWYTNAVSWIEQLSDMPRDWESSGAMPPNSHAIQIAKNVLKHLAIENLQPLHIDPSIDEGVCISFQSGVKYADIECFNSGDIMAAITTPSMESIVWQLSSEDVGNAIERIKSFLSE